MSTPRWRFSCRFFLGAILSVAAAIYGLDPASAGSRSMGPVPHGVISLELQRQLEGSQGSVNNRFMAQRAAPMVRLEVTSSHDMSSVIRRLGGRVRANVSGAVVAAEMPAANVAALSRQPGVVGLFPIHRFHREGDQSVADIRANQAWALQDRQGLPIKGDHVLVGIVDGGVDYHSPDFTNPDGSTRIRYIWDQTQNGRSPKGFTFGYECGTRLINSRRCPERDNVDGHGTHVLGTAAGNGRSTVPARELGVAPHADILVVKSDLSSDNVIAAWKYLIAKAHALHEPIVINNSFGDQDGPHNGTEPEATALDRLSGPGVIFVKSAGNAGHQGAHASGTVTQGGTTGLDLAPMGYSDSFDFEVFYPAKNSFTFSLQNTDTQEVFGPVKQNGKLQGRQSKDGDTRVSIQSGRYSATYREAYVSVASETHQRLQGRFRLLVRGAAVSGVGRYDAWMEGQSDAEFKHAAESATMSIPGDAHRVITVGNYATSTYWTDENNDLHAVCDNYVCLHGVLNVGDIAASSSLGPTIDGRQKPDIAAPGTMITSTLTHDAPVCTGGNLNNCVDPTQISADGKHLTYTGTSMAAPHVAGTVALMLQVNPQLTPARVDAMLRASARRDSFTGSSGWTPAFGAGKLDALAAVQRVISGTTSR